VILFNDICVVVLLVTDWRW